MQHILVIDNYDSFVFNLVHYLEGFDTKVTVVRNDIVTIESIAKFDKIVLSPGPGLPAEAGLLHNIIKNYAGKKSILGICLGHQAIGEVFGATLSNLNEVYHGVAHTITVSSTDEPLFRGLGKRQQVGRYHSWVVDNPLPDVLEVTSTDQWGNIMSLRHRTLDVRSVQFHPESILTPNGRKMIENWITT